MIEDFVPINPVNFFQFRCDCHYIKAPFPQLSSKNLSKYLLPSLFELCHEFGFAEIAMGWNKEGIEIFASISQPFRRASYPNITRGDSLEFFFDTRDVKTAGYTTRFSHHFFFLPESIEGIAAGEITRFRTEDVHELCNSSELKVKTEIKSVGYAMHIFIPSLCLFGYDPEQFDRLGFAYRINRAEGAPQHFCVTSDDYQIEQQPSLWSSMRLVK
jgi:hypothetical protein